MRFWLAFTLPATRRRNRPLPPPPDIRRTHSFLPFLPFEPSTLLPLVRHVTTMDTDREIATRNFNRSNTSQFIPFSQLKSAIFHTLFQTPLIPRPFIFLPSAIGGFIRLCFSPPALDSSTSCSRAGYRFETDASEAPSPLAT